jgi:hypothetical protein
MSTRLGIVIVTLSLTLPQLCLGENQIRPWESAGLWAPSAALAYADTAIADQPEAVFSNIAGLTQIPSPSLRYSHRPFSVEPNYDDLAYSQPFGQGSRLGLGLSGTRQGKYSAYEAVIGSAFKLGGVSAGVGVRSGDRQMALRTAEQTFSGDLGILWKAESGSWQIGSALLRLPLGPAEAVEPHLFALGASLAWEGLRFSLEGKLSAGDSTWQSGLECPLFDLVDLRLGLSSLGYQGAALGLSGGLGLHYTKDLSLDYAAYPTVNQGVLHCLSVGYSFRHGGDGFVDRAARDAREQRAQEQAWRQERERYAAKEAASAKSADPGDFPLEAKVSGRKVTLSWQAPGENSGELRFMVTQGMLPKAKFRQLNEPPQTKSAWEGEVSLQGVTYYFRVLSVKPDGSPGPASAVKAVEIP